MSAAARAIVGVQAQDVRAAALALRSRVPGLRRADVNGSGLIRTWTVRGTIHLIDPSDWPWLYGALLHPAVLIDGLAAGTWTVTATRGRCRVAIDWFRRSAEPPELRSEQLSVEQFLGPG